MPLGTNWLFAPPPIFPILGPNHGGSRYTQFERSLFAVNSPNWVEFVQPSRATQKILFCLATQEIVSACCRTILPPVTNSFFHCWAILFAAWPSSEAVVWPIVVLAFGAENSWVEQSLRADFSDYYECMTVDGCMSITAAA